MTESKGCIENCLISLSVYADLKLRDLEKSTHEDVDSSLITLLN